jgi:hypothetical protein
VRIGIATDTDLNTAFNNNPNASLFIEIIFVREAKTGIIRKDQGLLKCFINAGKIREDELRTINL